MAAISKQLRASDISSVPKKPNWKKRLWDTLTEYVHLRDGDMCRICKRNPGYALYHLVPQNEGNAVRYCEDNVVWGCRGCNCGESNHRARYARLHERIFGKDYMDRLWERSKPIAQFRDHHYKEMTEEYEAKIKAFKKL